MLSEWLTVDQAKIDRFAEATGDHQRIRVDPQRAMGESPFGGPVAHGFLTLSLIAALLAETLALEQRMRMNYGLNRARFVSPALVGSQLRARFAAESVGDIDNAGVKVSCRSHFFMAAVDVGGH